MSNTSKSEINLCGFKGNKKEMQREKKSLEIQSKTGLEMQREKKKIFDLVQTQRWCLKWFNTPKVLEDLLHKIRGEMVWVPKNQD